MADAPSVTIYCVVDEPYARDILADFQKETGIGVTALYDGEASKSVGLAAKLEAERDHPQADVWWGNEAFLTARLAAAGVLAPYASPSAQDIPAVYKDKQDRWSAIGLRARVLALAAPPNGLQLTSILDLTDPKLRGKIAMSRPTAGSAGAHVTALYLAWGPDKADAFFRALHANNIALLGGNAQVADLIGAGTFKVGLTDTDDIANTLSNGGKLTMTVPDQGSDQQGTLTLPTTVALVTGCKHQAAAKRLVDYLLTPSTERRLIRSNFCRWSVREPLEGGGVKTMPIDYAKAAQAYATSVRRAMAILQEPIE